MRKFITFVMLMFAVVVSAQVRNGNTFIEVRDTMVTGFEYKESDGKLYPIVVNKNTGSCYICKVSKNGKWYRRYLPETVKKSVCQELGIAIVERKNKK